MIIKPLSLKELIKQIYYKTSYGNDENWKVWLWLARRLPRKLVYWAAIRLTAEVTTGKFSDTVVTELTAMEALKRFELE